jgi:hypothetical protein
MKRYVKLFERYVRENEENELFGDSDYMSNGDMPNGDMPNDNMYGGDDQEEMSKPEVVELIAKYFKTQILPELEPEEKAELKQMARKATPEMTEEYLNEDLRDRFKSFKEKAMIGGGLATMVTGMITSLGEFTGYSESELTMRIHDFVEGFGAGRYSGPITVAMVFAGITMALKGYADRGNRLDTPYTKDKRGNGFNSY